MKAKICFILIAILPALFISCSGDDNPVENENGISAYDYYPGETGSYFNYSIDSVNTSVGGQKNVGTRTSRINETRVIQNTSYYAQANIIRAAGDSVSSTSFFRRTDKGVYFYVDTTGLYSLIPPDIRPFIKLDTDREINIFSSTLEKDKPRSAFELNVQLNVLLSLNIVSITAYYEGSESLNLNISGSVVQKESERIRYVVKITIPNPQDPRQRTEQSYTAYIWFAKGTGVVKLKGSASVLGLLTGGNILLPDNSTELVMQLTDYQLK